MINGAKDLVKLLLSQLFGIDHQIKIIKLSISLLLHTLEMQLLIAQEKLDGTEMENVFAMCEMYLKNWIERRSVVGGSFFGCRVENEMKLVYGSTELKVYALHCEHCSYILLVILIKCNLLRNDEPNLKPLFDTAACLSNVITCLLG